MALEKPKSLLEFVAVVPAAAWKWPTNLRLEGGSICYERTNDYERPEVGGGSIIADLRQLESASDEKVFAFVERWGPLGVGGTFSAIATAETDAEYLEKRALFFHDKKSFSRREWFALATEPTDDYRYCAKMIRELYMVGALLMRPSSLDPVFADTSPRRLAHGIPVAGLEEEHLNYIDGVPTAEVKAAFASLLDTLGGGFAARYGKKLLGVFWSRRKGNLTNFGMRCAFDEILRTLLRFKAHTAFDTGKAMIQISPEITPYWDARPFDDAAVLDHMHPFHSYHETWSFIPLVMSELIAGLGCDNAWCLSCKQPYRPEAGSRPRKDRCCSTDCQEALDKERKRKYWETKGKFLASQRDKSQRDRANRLYKNGAAKSTARTAEGDGAA